MSKKLKINKDYPYMYETHLHTSEGSACGRSTGAEMARACKAAGYTGIMVTDHFFGGNTAIDRKLPWSEWVENYCKGYELKKMGYVLEDQGWEMGDIQAIRVNGAQLETASDPRGRGVGMIVK